MGGAAVVGINAVRKQRASQPLRPDGPVSGLSDAEAVEVQLLDEAPPLVSIGQDRGKAARKNF